MPKDLSKLTLPIAFVAALLGSALGAGASYGASYYKLDEASKTAKQAQADVHTLELRLAIQMGDVKASLARIEGALGTSKDKR